MGRNLDVTNGSGEAVIGRIPPVRSRIFQRRGVRVLPIWGACLPVAVGACDRETATPTGTGPLVPDTVVSSIEVDAPERTIGILGAQVWVRASAMTEDGGMLYGSHQKPGRFSWSSSAPEVATVNDTTCVFVGTSRCYLVTGVSEGTATITATSQGVTGSTTVTVRDRARLAWSLSASTGSVSGGIAVGADGTIYVGTNDFAASRSLWYAVAPQGSILWSVDLPLTGGSTPAIGADGTLYLGSRSSQGSVGRMTAVAPGGSVRWVLEDLDPIRSSPAIGPDGTIYVAGGRHVYAVDPEGETQWTHERDDDVFVASSPAIASDGTIYVGGEDHLLYAINPDGSLRWTFRTGDRIRSSPSIGTDGTVYFGSYDGRLYAVHPDGTERWSVELHCGLPWGCAQVRSSAIGPDGTIYVGADGVYAVDPGGSILWNHYRGGPVVTTPILGADGTVYAASGTQGPGGDAIYALDAQGDLLWNYWTEGHIMGSPAIGVDGRIIATSFSGSSVSYDATVHAIIENESTNGSFSDASWPQERGNRANTGRAGG